MFIGVWVVGYHNGTSWDYHLPKSKRGFQRGLFQGVKTITE